MEKKLDLCVTFDLWETLIIDQPDLDIARGRMRCAGLHGVISSLTSGYRISPQDLERGYEESARNLQAIWSRNGHIATIEQIRLILELASGKRVNLPGDSDSIQSLENAYIAPIFDFPPRLNSDAIPALQAIRKRAHKIGLISNTGRSPGSALRQLMTRLEIIRFFDVTVFSDEARSRKPDKRIFQTAAHELGTELGKIVHIGDDPEADIWGAKQAGMQAILFDYDVPEGFKRRPNSLFALARADRHVSDSEIKPDARITSLTQALDYIDCLP